MLTIFFAKNKIDFAISTISGYRNGARAETKAADRLRSYQEWRFRKADGDTPANLLNILLKCGSD